MNNEYIRKEDVLNLPQSIERNLCGEIVERSIDVKDIESLEPADVASVVRCKDCKYNATTHKCLNPDSFFLIPKDDDFCSYGERRGEQDGKEIYY